MARPFIPAPNTALVEMVFTFGGQIIENTWHVQKGSPFTLAQLQALANTFDAWDNAAGTGMKNARAIGCTLIQIKTRALDSSSAPVWIYTLPVPRNGLINVNPMPGNVTFCITLQTGFAGRSQRGRIYWPGLWNSVVGNTPSNNVITAATATSFVNIVNALIASIAAIGSGYALVVVSYRTNGAWRITAQNTVITNAAYADLTVDSQRRRIRIGGK